MWPAVKIVTHEDVRRKLWNRSRKKTGIALLLKDRAYVVHSTMGVANNHDLFFDECLRVEFDGYDIRFSF